MKANYIKVTDEMAKPGITPQKRDSLTKEFRTLNLKISTLSTNKIKKNIDPKTLSSRAIQ
ncbi:MAG: hypothetical protein HC867_01550 [Bacteroidia bacterium]|nr:hypothetical protein [Bacteroidia bacterium]